jgi:predicted aspartyl protease
MQTARLAAVAAAIFLATALIGFPASAQDCQLKRVALLDMVAPPDAGAIVVPMIIGGKEALMAVDTGSSYSWLTETFADTIEGSRGTTSANYGFYFKNAEGDIFNDVIRVTSLQIGEVTTSQAIHFMVDPGDGEDGVDGFLGNNFLMNFDLELDPAAKKVGFYLHHECSEKSPVHWARQWTEISIKKSNTCRNKDRRECYASPTNEFEHLIVDVTLDGKTVPAFLDTGASRSLLDSSIAGSILGRKPSEAATGPEELIGISGEAVKARKAGFKNLSFSGIAVHDPQFHIAPIFNPNARMIIGLDKLKALHLFFAFKQRKIYATPAQ